MAPPYSSSIKGRPRPADKQGMPVHSLIRSAWIPAAGLALACLALSTSSSFAQPIEAVSLPAPSLEGVQPGARQQARSGELNPWSGSYRLFPGAYFNGPAVKGRPPFGPFARAESETPPEAAPDGKAIAERVPIVASSQVLAFYGKPGAPSMGILGEYPKEKLATILEGYAKLYDEANGGLGVMPAFYIIYGTCWPGGDIGFTKASVLEEYIQYAAERGWIVFLDHQIGKFGVEAAMDRLLPWLKYPNVHLALDPEWRTEKPMQEIGSVSAKELNDAQTRMELYLSENDLPGIRMLVVHQFKPRMITEREQVRADYDRVVLVHTADGFGAPALKRQTYNFNAQAGNIPVKGFKLFFESKVPGAGWDVPLMLPADVMTLNPVPLVIMYQ